MARYRTKNMDDTPLRPAAPDAHWKSLQQGDRVSVRLAPGLRNRRPGGRRHGGPHRRLGGPRRRPGPHAAALQRRRGDPPARHLSRPLTCRQARAAVPIRAPVRAPIGFRSEHPAPVFCLRSCRPATARIFPWPWPTAASPGTAWRTPWRRSAPPSSSGSGIWRRTCTPPPTASCCCSTTKPWTGSRTAAAGSRTSRRRPWPGRGSAARNPSRCSRNSPRPSRTSGSTSTSRTGTRWTPWPRRSNGTDCTTGC